MAEIDSSDTDLYIELVKMMNEKRNTMYERDFTNDMRNNSDNNNSTYSGRPFSNENELFGDLEETSESIYNVSDLSISSSSLPNLSDSLLEYFVERKELFEDLLGVGKSINDFLKLQAYLKTELSTVYMDGIKIMKILKENSIQILNKLDKYEKTRFTKLSTEYLDDDWNILAFGEVVDFLKALEELDGAIADEMHRELRIGVDTNEEQITKLTIDKCESVVKKYNAGHKLCLYFSNKDSSGDGKEIVKFLHILELINYLEAGDRFPVVSSEAEDFILACEMGESVMRREGCQPIVEKLLNYGEDVEKFMKVKNMVAEYVSTKNKVRVTHYPKSQGFPKKYFPMIGYEESPLLAIKLHLEEKTRLTPGQEVHVQCSAWYQRREPGPQIVQFKIRIQ